MRVGISLNSSYNVDDPREGARRMIERAAAARDAGLDSLFVGDHHITGPRSYYQNVPIMGRLLAEWGDRPAGALFLLPLWHPVLFAEQVATLASIHAGRFIVQAAVGPTDEQFTGMGVNPKHRPSRFEECLELARRLWLGETVSGTHRYQFTDARIAPLPPEHIDVWIGGEADAALDRAARLGNGWLAAPGLTPEQAGTQATHFLGRRALVDEPAAVAIRRDVYVGETDEEAQRIAGAIVERGYRGFDPSAVIFGSPETVADKMREYAEHGFTDIIVRSLVPDQQEAVAGLLRLAEVRERVADA
jgi:alkanesulfonate monooxygenase SsuD/methylene tetrahydromethanopterin reductase-like flavin-dependent oxidoreductase (luciferase family)